MPCPDLTGTEYIDAVVSTYYNDDWATALEDFVHYPSNKWCPTWIRRNYDVNNPPTDANADIDEASTMQKDIKYVFEEDAEENEAIRNAATLSTTREDKHAPVASAEPMLGKTKDDEGPEPTNAHWDAEGAIGMPMHLYEPDRAL